MRRQFITQKHAPSAAAHDDLMRLTDPRVSAVGKLVTQILLKRSQLFDFIANLTQLISEVAITLHEGPFPAGLADGAKSRLIHGKNPDHRIAVAAFILKPELPWRGDVCIFLPDDQRIGCNPTAR